MQNANVRRPFRCPGAGVFAEFREKTTSAEYVHHAHSQQRRPAGQVEPGGRSPGGGKGMQTAVQPRRRAQCMNEGGIAFRNTVPDRRGRASIELRRAALFLPRKGQHLHGAF